MKVFNTLTRKKEEFRPTNGKKVKMFVCGPTVYDLSHIGHAKTYVQFDIIAKYLRFKGYDVFYLQNITDIEDKIIKRSAEKNEDPLEYAKKFEKEYYKDMDSIKIDSVTKFSRATDHIPEIITQIETLLKKKFAYIIDDGVYFDLSKFNDYGKLSQRKSSKTDDAVSRIDDSAKKKNQGDFCLWKKSKDDEPSWNDPWLNGGRPGWHIEDTAITEKQFGPQYDIHGGSRDLIFPHHEAEIAQMEAASGKIPFVKYWLHTGFLNVEGAKMAKSIGNFITIREGIKKWSPEVFRFFFVSTHYRSPIDFTEKNLKHAKAGLERIDEFIRNVSRANGKNNAKVSKFISESLSSFEKHMDNDFDMPQAIAVIYDFIRDINKLDISKQNGKDIIALLKKINSVLGVMSFEGEKIPAKIMKIVEEREKARKSKDWGKADKMRDELKKEGYRLDDTESGTAVVKITK